MSKVASLVARAAKAALDASFCMVDLHFECCGGDLPLELLEKQMKEKRSLSYVVMTETAIERTFNHCRLRELSSIKH